MLNGVWKRLLFKRLGETEEQQTTNDEISILDPNLPIQNAIEYMNELDESKKIDIIKLFEASQQETGALFNRLWEAGTHLSPSEFFFNYDFQVQPAMVEEFHNQELIKHEISNILHHDVSYLYTPDAINALLNKPTNLFDMFESDPAFNSSVIIKIIDFLKERGWDDDTIILQLKEGLDYSLLIDVVKGLKAKDAELYITYAFGLDMIDMNDPDIVEHLIFASDKTYAEVGNIIRDSSEDELQTIMQVLQNRPAETGRLINSFYEADMQDLHPTVLVKHGLKLSQDIIEQWDTPLLTDYILQTDLLELDNVLEDPIYEYIIDQLDNPIRDAIDMETLQGRSGIEYAPVMIHILDEVGYTPDNIAYFLSNLRSDDKPKVPNILTAFAEWYSKQDLAVRILEIMGYQKEFIKELFPLSSIEETILTKIRKSTGGTKMSRLIRANDSEFMQNIDFVAEFSLEHEHVDFENLVRKAYGKGLQRRITPEEMKQIIAAEIDPVIERMQTLWKNVVNGKMSEILSSGVIQGHAVTNPITNIRNMLFDIQGSLMAPEKYNANILIGKWRLIRPQIALINRVHADIINLTQEKRKKLDRNEKWILLQTEDPNLQKYMSQGKPLIYTVVSIGYFGIYILQFENPEIGRYEYDNIKYVQKSDKYDPKKHGQ